MPVQTTEQPRTLGDLKATGWRSRSVKQELADNLTHAIAEHHDLFPGIVGYDATVIPELCIGLLAKHDLLFLGEKGQAKSRLMRGITRLLDPVIPFVAGSDLHDDPLNPITQHARELIAELGDDTPIKWWPRDQRYAERLAPGTKFADIIGDIDPAKLAAGTSMGAEQALHFGLIPRMNRGVFAMNEVPELDELVQVGLFNILEERDVQIRGYPIQFDLDIVVLMSANPATYNRSGKVIPQLKDRIGTLVRTHYPQQRELGIQIMEQEAELDPEGPFPVRVPLFMKEVCEQITIEARNCDHLDADSGVSARFSIANYRTMIASARRRAAALNEPHAVPRISDLAHISASAIGKIELDMMSSHQMSEQKIIESLTLDALKKVFDEYADNHGLDDIAEIFAKGTSIEVGDMLPSTAYADRLKRVPPAWEKAFQINPSDNPATRAACVEFVLAGLWAHQRISRGTLHGRITYET